MNKEIRNVIIETPQTQNSMTNAPFTFEVWENNKMIGVRPKGSHGVPNATMQMSSMDLMMQAQEIALSWLNNEFPPMEFPSTPLPLQS